MQSILESREQTSHTHFWPCPTKKTDQLLILINLYQHAKNETVSSIYSGEMIDLTLLMHNVPKWSDTL